MLCKTKIKQKELSQLSGFYQNPQEVLLKHRFLGHSPQISDSIFQNLYFTISQMMQMLPVQGPHFENYSSGAIFLVTDGNVLDKGGTWGVKSSKEIGDTLWQ